MKNLSLCLVFLVAGCAPTVASLRSTPPAHTLTSPMPANQIVSCVKFYAPEKVVNPLAYYYSFSQSEDPITGNIHLLAEINGQPCGEAIFKPNKDGGTDIELHSRWNFWGEAKFWDCIINCTSPKPTQNSPGK